MRAECAEHIKEYEKNQKWFMENFRKLLAKYKDKFVAVWNQKIIDFDDNLEKLVGRVRKTTGNAKGVYTEFVSDKPLEMVL